MFPRNKFFRFPGLTSPSKLCVFIYVLIIICLNNICLCEVCKHVTDCKCVFNNGSVVDLSSIGESSINKPVWENVPPHKNETYEYSYNPCHKFSLGNSGCKNVEVCQKGTTGNIQYFDVGSQAYPQWNNQNHTLSFIYGTTTARKTIVSLICSPNAVIPLFQVIGERVPGDSTYEMILTSRCACADLCSERHLSGGSVLVIIFMIFVSLYLILGIIHSSLTRGAHGWELIPNYEFWMDFPLLVRDGCVFVMSGCKPDTAYERI